MNKKIHLIGIGGIGLSGLAQILFEQGNIVRGSDLEDSEILKKLKSKLGENNILIGHESSFLEDDTNEVIYSSAIPDDNPELLKAKKINIPILKYAEAIKRFTEDLYTIAICGTHGKTTVTAFASLTLLAGDKDPTVIIGSELKEFNGSNYRYGKDNFFIVEACEYKRNFLNYSPDIIILTNLEAEHLDYFKDLEDYKNAFKEFVSKLPEKGFLIANGDDKNVLDVIKDCKAEVILFSKDDERIKDIKLKIPGEFNKLNALCGIILGQLLNIDREKILAKFAEFTGAWRRFEIVGDYYNLRVINDYAHHPTAIEATLKATHEKFPGSRICCIFQPHQYNRTKNFINEFGKAFKEADLVIFPNIYQVRDKQEDVDSVNVDDLIKTTENNGTKAIKLKEYAEIKNYIDKNKNDYDILMIMGAGDIWKFADYLAMQPTDYCINCED